MSDSTAARERTVQVTWDEVGGRRGGWRVNGRACTAEEALSILLNTTRMQANQYAGALRAIAESHRDSASRRLAREVLGGRWSDGA